MENEICGVSFEEKNGDLTEGSSEKVEEKAISKDNIQLKEKVVERDHLERRAAREMTKDEQAARKKLNELDGFPTAATDQQISQKK